MPDPQQVENSLPIQPYWWAEAWAGARSRFISVLTEAILSAEILVALSLFYFITRLFVAAGVPEESVKPFERVDYWLMLAVFCGFGANFVLEVLDGILVKIRKMKARESL